MARFTFVIPTIMLILSLAVTLALARNIPTVTVKATPDQQSTAMLTDEKNLHLGLGGFGGLGGGADIGGLPLIGGVGGYGGGAGGAGLHLGGNRLGGTGGGLGGVGGLGSGVGGIVP